MPYLALGAAGTVVGFWPVQSLADGGDRPVGQAGREISGFHARRVGGQHGSEVGRRPAGEKVLDIKVKALSAGRYEVMLPDATKVIELTSPSAPDFTRLPFPQNVWDG